MRRKHLRIALTGGIGTGKSTALAMFGRLGAKTVSLDEIAHRLSGKNGVLYKSIVKRFGPKFIEKNGELDRRALGDMIFKSTTARRRLEKIAHPMILKEMSREMERSAKPVVVVDVPLLFEVNAQRRFDVSVLVSASGPIALRRILSRTGMNRARIQARMRAQMPIKRKERLADVVIANDGSRKDLEKKVQEYYRAFALIASSNN